MSKKKYKKQKSAKADEYYNDGLFELARYGKVVSMRNLSTPEQHVQIQTYYKEEYPKVKEGGEILVGHGDDSDKVGCFDSTGFPGAMCNLTDLKRSLRKDTSKALRDNHDFFKSLSVVDQIYSIGFSYSFVDLVYIQEICAQIDSKTAVWIFNDYQGGKESLPHYKELIRKCGYTGKFEIQKVI